MKFYEDRINLKLILKDLFLKYNNLRAEALAVRSVVNEIYTNNVLSVIKYVTNNNDDKNNHRRQEEGIMSLSKDQ